MSARFTTRAMSPAGPGVSAMTRTWERKLVVVTPLRVMAGLVVLYAALARRLDRWSITSAILFTAAGLVCGARALDVLPLALNAESTKLLAELTLAVLLFADAATIDAGVAHQEAGLAAPAPAGGPTTRPSPSARSSAAWSSPRSAGPRPHCPRASWRPPTPRSAVAVFTNRAVPAARG